MKGPLAKLLVLAIATWLIVAACAAPPPPTPTPTPVPPTPTPVPGPPTALEVAEKFQAANAANDVDAMMALFADEFTYSWGDAFFPPSSVRDWLEWGVGLNGKTLINKCQADADGAVCDWRFVNDCMGPGTPDGFEYDMIVSFKVEDGKIRTLAVDYRGGYDYTLEEEPLAMWLYENYPDDQAQITTANFNRQFGEHIAMLCREFYAQKAAGVTSTPAPPRYLLKLAQAFQDAYNRRDLDAALALFVDEGLNYMVMGNTFRNKETLRVNLEAGVALGEKIEFVDCVPYDNGLRCTNVVRSNCLKAECGLDVYHAELTLKPEGGKIQLMWFRAGDVSIQDTIACAEAAPKYYAWIEANRPEEWKKLNAPLLYDLKGRALGELASQMCKAYLEATGK